MRSIARWFFNSVIRLGTGVICRIDKRDFSKVPQRGPLILAGNHIGSLEVPLLFVHLQPRKIYGLAKIETWNNKFMGWLFDLWNAIPVRRGEADLDAIRACLEVLKDGNLLAIAPEGTRSYHGRLLQGQPGIAMLALRTGAPILPLAHWGGDKVNGEIRQAMADEVMSQIADLMPEEYRGEYASYKSPPKYLRFI